MNLDEVSDVAEGPHMSVAITVTERRSLVNYPFINKIDSTNPFSAIAKLSKIMRRNLDDIDIQRNGLICFIKILKEDENYKELVRVGLGQLAINALKTYEDDLEITLCSLKIIGKLADNYSPIREAYYLSQALQVSERSLKLHYTDEKIFSQSMSTIGALHGGDLRRKKQFTRSDNEIASLIVEGLKFHSNNTPILSQAFYFIGFLNSAWHLKFFENKKKLIGGGEKKKDKNLDFYELGVLDVIERAMRNFKKNAKIHITALLAISSVMADKSARKKKLVKDLTVFIHLNEVVRTFMDNSEFMESLALFLEEITKIKESHKVILTYELHERLLTVSKNFTDKKHEQFHLASLQCFYQMAVSSKKNKRSLKNAEALEIALRVKDIYKDNRKLVKTATELVKLLTKIK